MHGPVRTYCILPFLGTNETHCHEIMNIQSQPMNMLNMEVGHVFAHTYACDPYIRILCSVTDPIYIKCNTQHKAISNSQATFMLNIKLENSIAIPCEQIDWDT